MSRRLLILGCLLPCLQPSSDVSGNYCRRGQFYKQDKHGHVLCFPCPDKTFMDSDRHNEKECINCKVVDEFLNEEEVEKCTRDSDTVFQCVHTHFKDHNNQCKRCKHCSYDVRKPVTARPCTRDNDTVCCEPGRLARWDDTDQLFNCVADTVSSTPTTSINETCEGSVYRENGCTAGEYMLTDCSSHDHRVTCKSCVDGTFMNLTLHNKTMCTPCSLPPAVGLLVQFVCNRTRDSGYIGQDRPPDTYSWFIWLMVMFSCFFWVSFLINLYYIFLRRERTGAPRAISSDEDVSLATVYSDQEKICES